MSKVFVVNRWMGASVEKQRKGKMEHNQLANVRYFNLRGRRG